MGCKPFILFLGTALSCASLAMLKDECVSRRTIAFTPLEYLKRLAEVRFDGQWLDTEKIDLVFQPRKKFPLKSPASLFDVPTTKITRTAIQLASGRMEGGGHGATYLAALDDGTPVAMKVLHKPSENLECAREAIWLHNHDLGPAYFGMAGAAHVFELVIGTSLAGAKNLRKESLLRLDEITKVIEEAGIEASDFQYLIRKSDGMPVVIDSLDLNRKRQTVIKVGARARWEALPYLSLREANAYLTTLRDGSPEQRWHYRELISFLRAAWASAEGTIHREVEWRPSHHELARELELF